MRAVIHTWSNHMVINSGRINGSLTLCDMGQKGSLPPPPSTIRSFVRPTYSYILIALTIPNLPSFHFVPLFRFFRH